MHLSVGFIGDPAGQLNTSANSGELATARALRIYIYIRLLYDRIIICPLNPYNKLNPNNNRAIHYVPLVL